MPTQVETKIQFDESIPAADISISDANGNIDATNVDTALDELAQHLRSSQAFLPLPLESWREIASDDIQNLAAHGGILAKDSTPILEYTNGDTDSCFRLNWAASDSNPIAIQIPLPPDLNTGAAIVLHFRAKMSGATDTPAIDIDSYFNEGDTKVSDSSAALTSSYAETTISIAAGDIPSGAQTLTIEFTPQAHTTDAIYVTATWLEYTRTTLTS